MTTICRDGGVRGRFSLLSFPLPVLLFLSSRVARELRGSFSVFSFSSFFLARDRVTLVVMFGTFTSSLSFPNAGSGLLRYLFLVCLVSLPRPKLVLSSRSAPDCRKVADAVLPPTTAFRTSGFRRLDSVCASEIFPESRLLGRRTRPTDPVDEVNLTVSSNNSISGDTVCLDA